MSHSLVAPFLRPLHQWAQHAQRHACRNAMAASTDLAARRREREEVQEFVDDLLARRRSRAVAEYPSLPAAARLG